MSKRLKALTFRYMLKNLGYVRYNNIHDWMISKWLYNWYKLRKELP